MMKEIEDLIVRLRGEMSSRIDDRDIVDILEVLQNADEKFEKLTKSLDVFEEKLTKEINGNEKLNGITDFQDGITLGLQTAKSMFLVRVMQDLERLK